MAERTITEADLRAAMRDPRYWRSGHPQGKAYAGWVREGWQALARAEATGGAREVRVRPYRRVRNGRPEQVSGYTQTRQAAQEAAQTDEPNRRSLEGARAERENSERTERANRERSTLVIFIGGAGDGATGIVRGYRQTARLGLRSSE